MYQKRRKCMVWLITAVFLVSMWPAFAFGSDSDNQTGISLDQAIRTVKDHFTIPAAYTDFSSSFNSSDNHHSWSLIWRDSSGQGGYFSAQVDAVTGEIISMNNWKPENGSRTYLPAISINEARDIGTRFLEKLIPQRMASLQPVPGNQMIPLTNYDSASYTLRWERIANNIPVAGDGVNLEINLRNGEITGYNLNWSTLPLPSPAQAISAQQAEQIFVTNEMVKLQYIIPPDYRPLAAKEKQSPLLVYTIAHESGGIIDAIKGTPLIPEPGQWLPNGGISYDQSAKGMEKRSKVASSPLTPEEEKEISQTANLISKEEAVAAVDKYIGIPAGTELQSSNLDRDWQNPDNRIWSLYWSPVSSKPSSSLYARVNARTAEIISFSLDIPVTADQKPDLTREAAQKIADDLIKKLHPRLFKQLKLDPPPASLQNSENQISWSFDYKRIINGIDCPSNSISININRASKKPTSFYLNWSEQEFPTAHNVLGSDKANQLFLQGLPLTLTYTQVYGNPGAQEMKLVYRPQAPAGKPQGVMINAVTGEWLNSDGKPVSAQANGYVFTDIAGHFAEKEIALLGQAGMFGEYGTAFHPDENITLISLLRAMVGIHDGYYTGEQTDQEIMNRAKVLGWLDQDYSPTSSVNREMLARLIVHYLELDYLTRVPDLFQITFRDKTSLSSDSIGYAALIWGLGVIKGNGVNFEPAHIVTRAEAAAAIVRTLKAKSNPE